MKLKRYKTPTKMEEGEYEEKVMAEFKDLLNNHSNEETKFQKFFEENPVMVPGGRGLRINSLSDFDLESINNILISQPIINGVIKRKPDFMWLSYDSCVFSPVIIEIEAPSKTIFNKDNSPNEKFTKARNQLIEWKTILSKPVNQLKFYDDFSIPQEFRDLSFEPAYLLIYGRRNEYWGNQLLTDKRKELMGENEKIMSFDRIAINYNYYSHITCKVKDGNYHAKFLSPLFNLNYLHKGTINKINDFTNAIESMVYTSESMKSFLREELEKMKK